MSVVVETNQDIVTFFRSLRPDSQWIRIYGYLDNNGGLGDYPVVLHIDYASMVRRSLEQHDRQYGVPYAVQGVTYAPHDGATDARAVGMYLSVALAIKASLQGTLERIASGTPREGDPYESICKGVKRHLEDDAIHIWGYVPRSGVVRHVEPVYPPVKSRPQTILRRLMERNLPVSRFRQFRLGVSYEIRNWNRVVAEHTSVIPEGWID